MNAIALNPDTSTETSAALAGSLRDYLNTPARTFVARTAAFNEWRTARSARNWYPYLKTLMAPPGSTTSLRFGPGTVFSGLNFASQDYLSLSAHASIKQAAVAAIDRWGVHSAGSPALSGKMIDGSLLERELSDFLMMEHVALYPTGWAAGYGVCKGLVRERDHVVMDILAHNCLQEGANAATRNVHLFRHLDAAHARKQLERVRATDSTNSILLVIEGTYSMDADSPDIRAFQELASEFAAMLVVDVAHDLGCCGPGGTGQIGLQGMLGKVDLVMGAFSKTFASNGGFVATHDASLAQYLYGYSPSLTFSNAISPSQIAVVREALRIVRSDEGEDRRHRLHRAASALRQPLAAGGLTVLGNPHAIVPVLLGAEDVARRASGLASERGLLTNLVEFPAVSVNTARFRMQVMADHSEEECSRAAAIVLLALEDAKCQCFTTHDELVAG